MKYGPFLRGLKYNYYKLFQQTPMKKLTRKLICQSWRDHDISLEEMRKNIVDT